MVISVGIDVSKDKHDCFILNSEGEVLSQALHDVPAEQLVRQLVIVTDGEALAGTGSSSSLEGAGAWGRL